MPAELSRNERTNERPPLWRFVSSKWWLKSLVISFDCLRRVDGFLPPTTSRYLDDHHHRHKHTHNLRGSSIQPRMNEWLNSWWVCYGGIRTSLVNNTRSVGNANSNDSNSTEEEQKRSRRGLLVNGKIENGFKPIWITRSYGFYILYTSFGCIA